MTWKQKPCAFRSVKESVVTPLRWGPDNPTTHSTLTSLGLDLPYIAHYESQRFQNYVLVTLSTTWKLHTSH